MKILLPVLFFTASLFLQTDSKAQDTITPPNPGGKTKVYISMIVNNISSIDAANQVIKADIVIYARWNDPRLVHNSDGNIIVSEDKIWNPFLTFSNKLSISSSFPQNLTILKDGTVLYLQRVYGEFSQKLFFRDFPFDEQNFEMRIIDISLVPNGISLERDTLIQSGLSNNISLSDWKFEDWSFENSKFTLVQGSQELSSLLFTLKAKRKSGYYLLIFLIPLLLIIMMSMIVFWLPSGLTSSQLSVGTTSMLTLIAYRFIVTSNLPKISYMTRMDVFILGSSVLIFLTLLQACFSSSLTSKGKTALAQKMDYHCRWIFPLAYLLIGVIALFL